MHLYRLISNFFPGIRLTTGLLAFSVLFILSSCGSVKLEQLMMLQEVRNEISSIDSLPPLVIQTDDILSIEVASRNPENIQAFQSKRSSVGSSGERALTIQEGYRVDEEGNIYLPFIDRVPAAGKTILELRQDVTAQLKSFIPDASVQIRYLNFRVTFLGEVNRPNTYTIPNERLTILEAIGMAGDFTAYANRDDVLVIRQRSDVREFARVNTQDKSIFESNYFYLLPNDIIYVEPLKAKQYVTSGDFFQRYSSLILPVVSLSTFIIGIAVSR